MMLFSRNLEKKTRNSENRKKGNRIGTVKIEKSETEPEQRKSKKAKQNRNSENRKKRNRTETAKIEKSEAEPKQQKSKKT